MCTFKILIHNNTKQSRDNEIKILDLRNKETVIKGLV